MRVVFGSDLYVANWVAGQLDQMGFAGNLMNAFGTFEGDRLLGGVVFHNFYAKEGVVEMTAASVDSRWLTKHMIRAMFGYAFNVLCTQVVVIRVSETNHRMVNIAKRFGFDLCTIPRLRGRDEAEVVCTFTDDQWLSSPFNRRQS